MIVSVGFLWSVFVTIIRKVSCIKQTYAHRKLRFYNFNNTQTDFAENEECQVARDIGSVYPIMDSDTDEEIGRFQYETKIEGNVMTIEEVKACLSDRLVNSEPSYEKTISMSWAQVKAEPILVVGTEVPSSSILFDESLSEVLSSNPSLTSEPTYSENVSEDANDPITVDESNLSNNTENPSTFSIDSNYTSPSSPVIVDEDKASKANEPEEPTDKNTGGTAAAAAVGGVFAGAGLMLLKNLAEKSEMEAIKKLLNKKEKSSDSNNEKQDNDKTNAITEDEFQDDGNNFADVKEELDEAYDEMKDANEELEEFMDNEDDGKESKKDVSKDKEDGSESEEDGSESEEDGSESDEEGSESDEEGSESDEEGSESEEDGSESDEDESESESDEEQEERTPLVRQRSYRKLIHASPLVRQTSCKYLKHEMPREEAELTCPNESKYIGENKGQIHIEFPDEADEINAAGCRKGMHRDEPINYNTVNEQWWNEHKDVSKRKNSIVSWTKKTSSIEIAREPQDIPIQKMLSGNLHSYDGNDIDNVTVASEVNVPNLAHFLEMGYLDASPFDDTQYSKGADLV